MNRDSIINAIPSLKIMEKKAAGIGTIFALHRIADINKNEILENQYLKVSEKYLEDTILKLKEKNYSFISLDELERFVQNNPDKKFAIFTLDDGYKDNFTTAYPIFKKYNIPFTIYIANSFPNKKAILWWYILEDLLNEHEEIITSKGEKFSCKNLEEKNNTFVKLREHIFTLDQENIVEEIKKYLPNYSLDFFEKTDELCITWEELKEMIKDPLVTIGSHTASHIVMDTLSQEELKKEVIDGKIEIENKLGITVNHFAYPYGIANDREFEFLKDAGFLTATTTAAENLTKDSLNFTEKLPRILLKENFTLEKNMFEIPFLRKIYRKIKSK